MDWTHDIVLSVLAGLPDPVGSLVSAFPGRKGIPASPSWLDAWFKELVESYLNGTAPSDTAFEGRSREGAGGVVAVLARPPVGCDVRLVSVTPHYFRGFRANLDAVVVHADLLVVEGLNSSGKTSVSEAIEWVLTGVSSRRSSGQGHPRELAKCIGNEFRPANEDTWVELVLAVGSKEMRLRRTLIADYSTRKDSVPESTLSRDGVELDNEKEAALFEELFASLHPLLMQHTLRQFVHDTPAGRRQYFERLLQIDELTELISRAVVGDTSLQNVVPEGGTPALSALLVLKSAVGDEDAAAMLGGIAAAEPLRAHEALRSALVATAESLFSVPAGTSFSDCLAALAEAQASAREAELPLLKRLSAPTKLPNPDVSKVESPRAAVARARHAVDEARTAASGLGVATQAAANAFEVLVNAGLVKREAVSNQVCPLCVASAKTLTAERVQKLLAATPIAAAVEEAEDRLAAAETVLRAAREEVHVTLSSFRVPEMTTDELTTAVAKHSPAVQEATQRAVELGRALNAQNGRLSRAVETDDFLHVATAFDEALQGYAGAIRELEGFVSASARQDPAYLLREKWLEAARGAPALEQELGWLKARRLAQARLDQVRKALIDFRSQLIEEARETFSEQMSEVWHVLRKDKGAAFSDLSIPTVRGKGQKLELEVKAEISDGSGTVQVDALRVFSESQVNAIGIAAYVTRAKLLGHRVLIFDDPVQSMDAEHFRTFASKLLDKLLGEGFQVIILTHNDEFAKAISHAHYGRLGYVTLSTRFSRRNGCVVAEGRRRVTERLKAAEKLMEEGELDVAWAFVRKALERLYTLAMLKADDKFRPEAWKDESAEGMWNCGAGAAIEARIPGSGARLKEILGLTVPGAHDKKAKSETDLVEAVKFLRGTLDPLRLGAG